MKKYRWAALFLVLLMAVGTLTGCGGGETADEDLPEIVLLGGDSDVAKLYTEGVQGILEQNLGIKVSIENVDFATRLEKMRNGEFDLVLAGWGGDYNDPSTFLDLWITDGPFNDVGWSNADYDAAIQTARTSTDNTERMEAFAAAEGFIAEELPIIPLYWTARNWVQKDYVHGILRKPTGSDNEWKYAYVDKDDNTLRLNLGENPPDLDPQTSTDTVSFDVLNAVLEGLMRIDEEGALQPGLAESYEISDDGTVYTFTLREGLKWSDGEPITANDFEYAWKRTINPLTGAQYNYQMEHIAGAADAMYFEEVEMPSADELSDEEYAAALEEYKEALQPYMDAVGIEVVDDLTLEVTLAQASPFFLDLTSFVTYIPAPMHLVEELGDDYAINADNMAFSGPFAIESWAPDDEIVFVKNDNYWDADAVKLDKIEFSIIKEISTYINMYETGDLDVVGVPGTHYEEYKDRDDFGSMAEAVNWYLEPNLNNDILGNNDFRKAISLAFDRQSYADAVLANGSWPATAHTPPSLPDGDGNSFVETWLEPLYPVTADIEAAKEALATACETLGYKVPAAE